MKIIYRDIAEYETNEKKSQLCAASLSLRVCEDKAGILSTTSMQEGQPTMALTMALTPMGSLEFPTNLMFIESKKKLEYTETQRHKLNTAQEYLHI